MAAAGAEAEGGEGEGYYPTDCVIVGTWSTADCVFVGSGRTAGHSSLTVDGSVLFIEDTDQSVIVLNRDRSGFSCEGKTRSTPLFVSDTHTHR